MQIFKSSPNPKILLIKYVRYKNRGLRLNLTKRKGLGAPLSSACSALSRLIFKAFKYFVIRINILKKKAEHFAFNCLNKST